MTRNEWRRGAARARGFTMVELLVVVAIIAILLTFLVPAALGIVRMARRASCANNLSQMDKGYKQWAEPHGGNFPLHRPTPGVGDSSQGGSVVWYRNETLSASVSFEQSSYTGPGALAYREYIGPAVMYCPASVRDDLRYLSVNTTGSDTGPWWPSNVMPAAQNRIQISYVQRSSMGAANNRSPNTGIDKSYEPVMSDAFEEAAFREGQHPDGFNVLYMSSAVKFVTVDPLSLANPGSWSAYETVFTTVFPKN